MVYMRERMVDSVVETDALRPEWCHQNEAMCYVKKYMNILKKLL